MKSIVIFALIAALAVGFAAAADCDDGECTSTVAVQQSFASTDCSGNATIEINFNYTIPCTIEDSNPTFPYSRVLSCSAKSGLVSWDTLNSSSCAKGPTTIVTSSAVGTCIQNGHSSYINWCNQASISSNFKPAKPFTNESIIAAFDGRPCNETGCTGKTGTIRQYGSSDYQCKGNASLVFPASVLANGYLDIDTCYTTNDTSLKRGVTSQVNMKVSCGNGRYTIVRSTNGCGSGSNFLSAQSYPADTCFPYEGNLKITCPNAASALVAGPLVFILFAILLFI